MMRLFVLDKTAVQAPAHERFSHLAQVPGIELHVLQPTSWIEGMRRIRAEKTFDENYTIHLASPWFEGSYSRGFYWRGLTRALIQANPDIVLLLEEPWSFFLAQTLLVLHQLHMSPKTVFYTWENIDRGWHYPSRIGWIHRIIDRQAHRHCNGAICATQTAHDILIKKGFTGQTAVVPYGVDQHFFEAAQRSDSNPKNSNCFRIGYVGRLLPMKGVDLLIEAFAQLDEHSQLIILGNGPEKPVLENQIHSLGIQNRVRWQSAVPSEQVPEVMQQFDCLVLPSRTIPTWAEQLGRVLLEAMACGVPVIGSSCGSIPEVIGEAGLVFQENNAEDLRAQLLLLREHPEQRQRLIVKGRQHVLARYHWQLFATRVAEFCTQLLQP